MANPLQFLGQVRSEVAKVVWPSRREVMLTTVMVFIMAAVTAVFFFLIDLIIQTGLGRHSGYGKLIRKRGRPIQWLEFFQLHR